MRSHTPPDAFAFDPVVRSRIRLRATPQQELIWAAERQRGTLPAYHLSGAFGVGGVSVQAVVGALQAAFRRHRLLHATFAVEEGTLYATIGAARPSIVAPAEPTEAAFERTFERLVNEHMSLQNGPLVRAVVSRAAERVVLGLVVHHIVCDAWSWLLLLDDIEWHLVNGAGGDDAVLDGYEAYVADGLSEMSPLPPWIVTERVRQLPFAMAARGSGAYRTVERELPRVPELGLLAEATAHVLLRRFSGNDDVCLWLESSGRDDRVEDLVGLFAFIFPYRTTLPSSLTVAELLERLRHERRARSAVTPSMMRAARLVASAAEPDVLFRLVPDWRGTTQMLRPFARSFRSPGSKLMLTLSVHDTERPVLEVGYDDAISPEHAAVIADRFVRVFMEMHAGRESLVDEVGRRELPAPRALGGSPSDPDVFETIVVNCERYDDDVAIDGLLPTTYRQLGTEIERIRGGLRACRLRRAELVAVYGPKSASMIAGLIAVVLEGGVVQLIDDRHPSEWTASILARTQPSVELRDGRARRVASTREVHGANEMPALQPAYLFTTSGTTGVPKAVVGARESLNHFIAWERTAFHVDHTTRLLSVTTVTFDAVLRDLLLPLSVGGTVVLSCATLPFDAEAVLAELERERITMLHTTPGVLAALASNGGPQTVKLSNLRLVLVAGERLDGSLVHSFERAFPEAPTTLVNLYGATETTLVTASYVVPRTANREAIIPVGKGIPGSELIVLSERRRPCGPLESGEVFIRTTHPSLGYFDDDSGNERFVKVDGALVEYRTGDAAFSDEHGDVTIYGRCGDVTKIRGVRVDPSLVERALRRDDDVEQAAVVVIRGAGGESLRAVVAGDRIDANVLRERLKERLPAEWIPAEILVVDALPLMRNGKLDRSALRTARYAPALTETPAEDAGSETVRRVKALWETLLGRSVALSESFFDIGGHSLLATVMVAAVRREIGAPITLRELFLHPQLDAFAAAVEDCKRRESRLAPPALDSIDSLATVEGTVPLVLVHPTGGDVVQYRLLAAQTGRTVLAIRYPGIEGGSESPSLEQLAARYLADLRRRLGDESFVLGGWSLGGLVALEMATQLLHEGLDSGEVLLIDTRPPAEWALYPTGDTELAAKFAAEVTHFSEGNGLESVPPSVIDARRSVFMRLWRLGVEYARSYRSGTSGPDVLLCRASEDGEPAEPVPPSSFTAGALREALIHGDHYSILNRSGVTAIATLCGTLRAPRQLANASKDGQ